jgi:uncharacterized protein YlxW (UPF0749 family)
MSKKPNARDATERNVRASKRRDTSLAARVRRLEQRVNELAKLVRDTSTSLAKAPRR